MKKTEFQKWYHRKSEQGHHFYASLSEIEIAIWTLAFAFEFFKEHQNIEDKNQFLKQILSLNGYLAYRAYYRSHGQLGFPIYNCQEEEKGEMIKQKISFRIELQGELIDIMATPEGQISPDRILTDMGITAQTLPELLRQLRDKTGNYEELERSIAIQENDAVVRSYIEKQVSFLLAHKQSFPEKRGNDFFPENYPGQKIMKK